MCVLAYVLTCDETRASSPISGRQLKPSLSNVETSVLCGVVLSGCKGRKHTNLHQRIVNVMQIHTTTRLHPLKSDAFWKNDSLPKKVELLCCQQQPVAASLTSTLSAIFLIGFPCQTQTVLKHPPVANNTDIC